MAGLIGPTLAAMTLSELLHLRIWTTNDPRVTYLNGVLLFLGGVAILRAHNRWVLGWPVLVTLTGCFGVLGGLFRMFAPEAPQAPIATPTYVVIASLFAVACLLTYEGYRPSRPGEPRS